MVWDRSTGLSVYLARRVLEVSAQKKRPLAQKRPWYPMFGHAKRKGPLGPDIRSEQKSRLFHHIGIGKAAQPNRLQL